MSSITDYLYRIQELTNKNLKILTAINDAFTSKKEHLGVTIDGNNYVIPSFIALENKINALQSNFENLVDAPLTGEVNMTFDGSTQRMQMMGYSNTPSKVDLKFNGSTFKTEQNDIFKDFMTPTPFLELDLSSVTNCTKNVIIKKIALRNPELVAAIDGVKTTPASEDGMPTVSYSDVKAILYNYTEDIDYVDYDTLRRMPVKTSGCSGEYTVKRIISHDIDSNFEEHYELEVNEDLVYYTDSGTIANDIQVDDFLVTNDDTVKVVIEAVQPALKIMKVKVLFGAYSDITDVDSMLPDKYKLKYYRQSDFDMFKYVNLPLEEDTNICVFIAPMNDTLNIQAPYGNGLYIDTGLLTISIDGKELSFPEYYKTYVNNIGDTLFGITSMVNNTINNITKADFDAYTSAKPELNDSDFTVTQINKHLDNSAAVQEIRRLYKQKSELKGELSTVDSDISKTLELLSNISFEDTTGNREKYTSKLAALNSQKVELSNSIAATSQSIAENANNSELPIENAKYHIRGFVSPEPEGLPKVIKIDVEYRYKNKNSFTGNAMTIGENGEFIYSDWNIMNTYPMMKRASIDSVSYTFDYIKDNSGVNEPSFNQIDIPISQGESVDFKVRYVYDLGWPFVKVTSEWSEVKNIEFPTEFLKNVEILDIIEENNNDIKTYQFEGLLNEKGIIKHTDDGFMDQDVQFFHHAESVASGFYTDERRVIPLKDKLSEMESQIFALQTEVLGASSDNLIVTLSDGNATNVLKPFISNAFAVENYADAITDASKQAEIFGGLTAAYKQLMISFYNAGEYNVNLYSMFPGDFNENLVPGAQSFFDGKNYVTDSTNGVWMKLNKMQGESTDSEFAMQRYNQFIYFRMNDVYNGNTLYETLNDDQLISNNAGQKISSKKNAIPESVTASLSPSGLYYATMFPYIGQLSGICINNNDKKYTLEPGESITVPISFFYWFNEQAASDSLETISRTMSFDIRTSLYRDPVNYRFTVSADYNSNIYVKGRTGGNLGMNTAPYTSVIVKTASQKMRRGNSNGNSVITTKTRR